MNKKGKRKKEKKRREKKRKEKKRCKDYASGHSSVVPYFFSINSVGDIIAHSPVLFIIQFSRPFSRPII